MTLTAPTLYTIFIALELQLQQTDDAEYAVRLQEAMADLEAYDQWKREGGPTS